MQKNELMISNSWKEVLSDEFTKEYFHNLQLFLAHEQSQHTIYPSHKNILRVYNNIEFKDIKVVILGQDPYHGFNQAHGLSFSVEDGVTFPPSLKNIFKELVDDIDCSYPSSGNLSHWESEGVFLLNSVLSVRASEAHSHKKKGWEVFTDATIKSMSDNLKNVVFILWGKPAQEKEKLIDEGKHLVLKAPHPSPLSSYRGFFTSKPFSKTNEYLIKHGKKEISWCLD